MAKNEIGKTLFKPESNILQLMMKANKTRNQIHKDLHNLPKNSTFSLPKLISKDEIVVSNNIYCHILPNEQSEVPQISQDPLISTCQKAMSKLTNQRVTLHRTSLLFMQISDVPNKDFFNKYVFTEIAQDTDVTYFFKKIFEPEIALFMNGANKVIAVISQNAEERKQLDYLSNYILKTNDQLEQSKRRIYMVKFLDQKVSSFELSEKVDFRNSSISIITPKTPPLSFLFVINLINIKEINCFAEIIKKVHNSEKNKFFQPKYSFFKELCEIIRKNCCVSTVLFLNPFRKDDEEEHSNALTRKEKETEKLVKLFCLKKKSFFVDSKSPKTQTNSGEFNSPLGESHQGVHSNQNQTSNSKINDEISRSSLNSSYKEIKFNHQNKSSVSPTTQERKNSPHIQIDTNQQAEKIKNLNPKNRKNSSSDLPQNNESHSKTKEVTPNIDLQESKINDNLHIKELQLTEMDPNLIEFNNNEDDFELDTNQYNELNSSNNFSKKNIELNSTEMDQTKSSQSENQFQHSNLYQTEHVIERQTTLFDLLKNLNSSEKISRQKTEKMSSIRIEIERLQAEIESSKEKLNVSDQIETQMRQEIIEIKNQTQTIFDENVKLKEKIKEMIKRTGALETKYKDLLVELQEQDENARKKQMEKLKRKREELKSKIEENESKWRKEVEMHRTGLFKEKENLEINKMHIYD